MSQSFRLLLRLESSKGTELKDEKGLAKSYNDYGSVLFDKGNISLSLDYFNRGIKIQEAIGDKEALAISYNNLGHVFEQQKDYDKCLELYFLSLKMRKQNQDLRGMAIMLNNIGVLYKKKGNNDSAIYYYNESLTLRKKIKDIRGVSTVLNNLGSMYKVAGDIKKALTYHLEALQIREQINDKVLVCSSLNTVANDYYQLKKYSETERYGQRALELSRVLGFPDDIGSAAKSLWLMYKTRGKFEKALSMYELFIQMRDSLSNVETKKASIKSQLKYEYEKRAAADSVKNSESQKVKDAQLQAQNAQIKNEKYQRYALIVGLLFVVSGLLFVVNRFRITQKQKKIIEDQKIKVDEAFEKLAEKNKEVLDSIHYAKKIQNALLTSEIYIQRKLSTFKTARKS